MMSATRWRQALAAVSVGVAVMAAAGCSSEVVTVEGEADFYIAVQLVTGFEPRAVDRLDMVIQESSMTLEDGSGELYDGEITWETREGARSDELFVRITGDYFQQNAYEMPGDVHEIDIPFLGGLSGETGQFRVEARAFWLDLDEEYQQIGFGTGVLDLPTEQGTTLTVQVDCSDQTNWGWTCQTGCAPASNECTDGIDQCGTGFWECVDNCCEPADG